MSILNIRFRGCAQVIPDKAGQALALGGRADFCVGDRLDAFPAPAWCDQPTTAVVRRQDTVVTSVVDAGFGYQGSQTGNEIHRFEGHLCRSISVRCLQRVDHLARGAQ